LRERAYCLRGTVRPVRQRAEHLHAQLRDPFHVVVAARVILADHDPDQFRFDRGDYILGHAFGGAAVDCKPFLLIRRAAGAAVDDQAERRHGLQTSVHM